MAATDTLINTLFDGRYKIIRKLGSGGMANVYLAEDQELGRRVAIKILNERHANDEQFVDRFRREAKHAAGLSHPNIVAIYDRGEAEGTYYIAMEYLDGRSLKELIVARGPAPVHVAIDYARKILDALRFSHRNGIVHRDIKPHNVIVDAEGRVKVTDFGIARAGTSQMTEVGSIIGTAQYLSPEQAKGAPVDQTSDLYSVGIVLYELLTGKVPFSGDSPVEIAMKHISAIPEPPSSIRPDIPEDLDLIVLRALGKTPEERYPSAEEMDKDLGRVAQGLGVSRETEEAATMILSRSQLTPATMVAAPPRPPAEVLYEYEQPRRGRPGWPWLLVALLVLAAALTGWFVLQQVRDQLAESGQVAVPFLVDLEERQAVALVLHAGLEPNVIREASADVEAGFVIKQEPTFGTKVDSGSQVDIWVSTGPPQTEVPDVIGQSRDEAVAALARADLEAKIVEVFSEKEPGTVTGQAPAAGEHGEGRYARADQRLARRQAAQHSGRPGPAVRVRRLGAPGRWLQGRASQRRLDRACGHRRRPAAICRKHGTGRVDDHPQRLEGPGRPTRSGRAEPGGGGRRLGARVLWLHGQGGARSDRRPELSMVS